MSLDEHISRRLRVQNLGVTYYSNRKINFWAASNREELKKWALTAGHGVQGVLAVAPGHALAKVLAEKFNHNFDAYDKAIDAAYNAGLGSGSRLHHLLDGQHSIWGALKAVKGVSEQDSFFEELFQACEHLLRDLCSVSGINPLFSMTRETFDSISALVQSLGLSKMYLADALTVNGPEILGGVIGMCSILLGEKSRNNKKMTELSGSLVLAMLVSANPALLPFAGYATYKAFKGGESADWAELCISSGKGAIVTGSAIAVPTAIATLGGPVWLGLGAALLTSIGVRVGIDKAAGLWREIWPAYQRVCENFPHAIKQVNLINP